MAAMSTALIKRIKRARRRRDYCGGGDGLFVEGCANYLERARASNGPGVTYWRQSLTVTAARLRAEAGDRTERRLAWRKTVIERKQHATWLEFRFKAIDHEFARILRGGAPCGCCAERLEHVRENREWYLADIAKLPRMVVTYAEFARGGRPTVATGDVLGEGEEEQTITPEQTLAEAGISSAGQATYQRRMSTLLGRGGRVMPDYHGYRYEVKEVVAGNFCETVWPLEAPRATPGLVIVPKASSAAEAERTVKEWIDSENRKNAASEGA